MSMIPIRLNLLPEEKRRAHRRMIYMQFTKNMLEVLLILLCLSSIILMFGLRLLQNRVQDMASGRLVAESAYVKTNREVDVVNAAIRAVERTQDAYVYWPPILAGLSNAIPPTIRIDALSVDVERRTVSLSGFAPTRDTLLLLKQSLEKISWAMPFGIPIQQLTEKENVSFSFSFRMKE